MKKRIAFFIGFLFGFSILYGAITGEQILKKVDERMIGEKSPQDLKAVMTMKIMSSSGTEKVRKLKTWSKNNPGDKDDWRMMKFMSPPDVENMGFLVRSDDQMYLYLPEFRRIRRIASHNKTESFVGSDFSYEDMGTSGFAEFYKAVLVEENDEEWVLELIRKKGADKPYPRIKMWVSKQSQLPSKMEMYDEDGTLWKVMEEKNEKVNQYWISVKIIMHNKKEGSWSSLNMDNIKVDQGIEDEIFTRRFLKRRVK
ncbi:outer membrane lipoprotein-sorting protein [bacterium]|nr:outer membrane lipoprotein-sorting protein [bacterium]